ncbi:MAG: hypothetical protein V1888_01540 [archaeon]
MDKKGDYKWGIVLSLILGLMVLTLSLYFIFNELWTGNEAAREVCRQSIQVRALLPAARTGGFEFESFKEEFPLKCKTNVVEISKSNVERNEVGKIIAETMAECWALYGKGDENAFPADVYGLRTTCIPCARIHLSDEAKVAIGSDGFNIRDALDLKMDPQYSYYVYLRDSGKKFPAFNPAFSREFDFSGNEFRVDEDDGVAAVFKNRLTGTTDSQMFFNASVFSVVSMNKVYLSKILDPMKGDLLINYGILTTAKEASIGDYIPYLFYFQSEDGNPFEEVQKQLFDGFWWKNSNVCDQWEGIPA